MKVTYQLEVNAPIGKVFDMVDDDENLKLWMEGLEEIIYPSGYDPAKPVGTEFRQRIREAGRVSEYKGEIVAYEKPRHIGIHIGNQQFLMRVDYRFTPTVTGTRLDYRAEMLEASRFVRIISVLFGWFTRRILDKQMKKLKELAEEEDMQYAA
jgi:uncharacterized protein YndB with AHSA1/START domain